jgi:hypothetical protein
MAQHLSPEVVIALMCMMPCLSALAPAIEAAVGGREACQSRRPPMNRTRAEARDSISARREILYSSYA